MIMIWEPVWIKIFTVLRLNLLATRAQKVGVKFKINDQDTSI